MPKRFVLAVAFAAVLLPSAALANRESELVRVYYTNSTARTIKVLIDGRYAIETNWGNELRPGAALRRFATPGLHAFEAVALEHKYFTDWIVGKALLHHYFAENEVSDGVVIEFRKENFVKVHGWDFVRMNSAALLNFAVFAAMLSACVVVFAGGVYALFIKKPRP